MSRYRLSRFPSHLGMIAVAAALVIVGACAAPPPPCPPCPTCPACPPCPTGPAGPAEGGGPSGVTSVSQVSFERSTAPKVTIVDGAAASHVYDYPGDPALASAVFLFSRVEGVTWEKPVDPGPEFLQLEVAAPNAGKVVLGPSLNGYADPTKLLKMAGVIGDRVVTDQAEARALAQAVTSTSGLSTVTLGARLKWTEDQTNARITLTFKLKD